MPVKKGGGLQRRLHSAPYVKRKTRILSIGVGAFIPILNGNKVISCQNVDTVR